MKIGIIGSAERAAAWEKHLRPHAIVHEVEISASFAELGKADACVILDDSPHRLDVLLEGIQRGLHCYLVAPPSADTSRLRRIHSAAAEAGVAVQFSHWPVLAPATQWMMDEMPKARFMHITRSLDRTSFPDPAGDFSNLWLDELGLCLKWMGSSVHHLEANLIQMGSRHPVSIHLFLRFENGSTASVIIFTAADEDRHSRIISDKTQVFECNVPSQTVRAGRPGEGEHLFFSKMKFEPEKAAEKSILLFLKAIQLGDDPVYSTYDALNLAQTAEMIHRRLARF